MERRQQPPPIVGGTVQGGAAKQVGAMGEAPSGHPSPENTPLRLATRPLCSHRRATLDQAASRVCLRSPPQCFRQSRRWSPHLFTPQPACGLCSNNAHDCGLSASQGFFTLHFRSAPFTIQTAHLRNYSQATSARTSLAEAT